MVSGIYLPLRKLLLDFVHLISSSNHDSYRLQRVYALLSFSGNAGSTIERVVVVVVVVVVSIVYFPRCCSSGGPSSGKLGGGFLLALCALSSLEEFQFFCYL